MLKNETRLIVNSGFLIDKLIIKHKIAQITLVQYMLELGLMINSLPVLHMLHPAQAMR